MRQTGKKTLIRGGVWTSVCVMFPALDAKAAGFKVYVVMDASGEGTGLTAKLAYRRIKIDGLDIFHREAGPKDAPAALLLQGFPTSSHMFRNLIPALADEFRLSYDRMASLLAS